MPEPTTAGPQARAGQRAWLGLAVLALPTLLVSLDMSVLFLALPQLTIDLGATSTQQLWILDSYGFMVAGFLVTMGTLGDRIGRRRLLLIGATAFTLASLLAAYSTSATMLIGARALLGIAGATLMPSTLALISTMFRDAQQRAVAIAVWMSCFLVGVAIGPVVGGVLLEWFWWGSVFLLGVPVMVLLLVTGPVLLPEYRAPESGRLDLTSVAMSLATILPLVYGSKELARHGWQPVPVAAAVAGLVVGVLFVRRQRRLPDPLLDLRLFGQRSFSTALGVMLGGAVVMAGTFLFIPLYLQLVEGLSPLRAGLWLVPQSLAMIASTQLAPRLARRIRPAYVIAAGLAVAATGCLLLTTVGGSGGLAVLLVGFTLACVGVAPPTALGTDLVIGSAPPERAGSASSVSETSNEFGIALGMATLGSLGTAVYRGQLDVPAEVPTAAAEAARESIAGAVTAAESLPAGPAAVLLDAAAEAFATGLNTVAWFGAAVFAVLAVVAVAGLRQIRPSGTPGAGDQGAPDQAGPADQPELAEPVPS